MPIDKGVDVWRQPLNAVRFVRPLLLAGAKSCACGGAVAISIRPSGAIFTAETGRPGRSHRLDRRGSRRTAGMWSGRGAGHGLSRQGVALGTEGWRVGIRSHRPAKERRNVEVVLGGRRKRRGPPEGALGGRKVPFPGSGHLRGQRAPSGLLGGSRSSHRQSPDFSGLIPSASRALTQRLGTDAGLLRASFLHLVRRSWRRAWSSRPKEAIASSLPDFSARSS